MAVAGATSFLQRGPQGTGPTVSFADKMRVTSVVNQLRDGQLPSASQYVPLRQLPVLFPDMSDTRHAALILHVLTEAGMGNSVQSELEMSQMALQIGRDRLDAVIKATTNLRHNAQLSK